MNKARLKFRSYRQRQIFEALRDRGRLSAADLIELLWPYNDPPEWADSIVRVEIHRLRATLKPFNLVIQNIWGQGWKIERAGTVPLHSRRQQILFDALQKNDRLSTADLVRIFWPNNNAPKCRQAIVHHNISRLRRKLDGTGMTITNIYDKGWKLEGVGHA